ncbi:uncharacterized protein LOC133413069 isoform X2 [Phycodurus eques]|uniref:uncharacterized protein LOC133413069 isoform X2 n=1 Tax=Phycodurus eques TaxID=693459 RepID=UPI002ACE2943|nr:uncharacterized protein LOC133413069 isoform X2 [Phycodurus eques]
MEAMAYVTELRLGAGRGSWGGAAPSSCPEVDLEVIEEYLQEHSLEVQPAHTHTLPLTNAVQYVHSHHSTRIIENSWSGQHAYEWHCGAPNKEHEAEAAPPSWPHHDQWVRITLRLRTRRTYVSTQTLSPVVPGARNTARLLLRPRRAEADPTKTLHFLLQSQERGRSACSSSCLRCCKRRLCEAASGGSSPPRAHFSSPPKTKSTWQRFGAAEKGTARQ